MPTRDEEADQRAGGRAEQESGQERERPGHVHDVVEHDEDRHRDAAGDAGGQVDLAQQQDEHEGHAQHDEARGLVHEVREVAGGEEVGAQDREEDAEDDESADRRQSAHLAAADALPPGVDLLAQTALHAAADEVARDRIRRGVRALDVAHAAPPSVVRVVVPTCGTFDFVPVM